MNYLSIIITFLKSYWQVFAILAIFLFFGLMMQLFYKQGYNDCNNIWQEKEQHAKLERLKEIREYEAKEEERQNLIIADFQKQLKSLKEIQAAEVAEIIDSSRSTISDTLLSVCDVRNELNRVCDCANDHKSNNQRRLPAAQSHAKGITCYTTDQLRRKIAQSVAIGQECDREMIRFKALIETCSKE